METTDPNMQQVSEEESLEDLQKRAVEDEESLSHSDVSRMIEEEEDPKKKKYIQLWQARWIISQLGTMGERNLCRKQLKRMKKLGIRSV